MAIRVQTNAYFDKFTPLYYADPDGVDPFGIIKLGPDSAIYFGSPAEIDALITAAVELKTAMLGTEAVCGVTLHGSQSITCGLAPGHDGDHIRETGDRSARFRWPNESAAEPVLEDEADAAAVLAEAIRNGTPVIVTDDAPALEGEVTPFDRPVDAPYAGVRPRLRRTGKASDEPEASRM